jgi:hypothetical protein
MDELARGDYVEYDDSSLARFVEDIKTLEESQYAGKDKSSLIAIASPSKRDSTLPIFVITSPGTKSLAPDRQI